MALDNGGWERHSWRISTGRYSLKYLEVRGEEEGVFRGRRGGESGRGRGRREEADAGEGGREGGGREESGALLGQLQRTKPASRVPWISRVVSNDAFLGR